MGEVTTAAAILSPAGKEIQYVPFELVNAVDRCDQILRRYGMQMMIVCEHCHAHGHRHPYVAGDNKRFGSEWTMTCAHAERRYDVSL